MSFIEKILSVVRGKKEEKKGILVIDNRFLSLEFLKNVLCRRYEVLIAQDKEEGLSKALFQKPNLIILNSKLKKERTLDLCRGLRIPDETKNIPILIIAEKGDDSKVAEFYVHKIEGFLMEPFSKRELLNQVRAIFLDRR
ncbi:MAG: response regulator [Candidatus Omnitrophica bacterium]|nr:response regulator [Candidatus Omnitrophota bacterium]